MGRDSGPLQAKLDRRYLCFNRDAGDNGDEIP